MKFKNANALILTRDFDGQDVGVIEVGIVTDKVDSYNTRISPDGFDSPVESVVIDYRHKGINCECRLIATEVRELNGIKTLIGIIEIPKNARLYTKGTNGETVDDGSAYEAIKSGRIRWVSVEFDDRGYEEYTLTDKNGRVHFNKWRCIRITLLDQAAGQDGAYIIKKTNFRNMNTTILTTDQGLAFKGEDDKIRLINGIEIEVQDETEATDNQIRSYLTETYFKTPANDNTRAFEATVKTEVENQTRALTEQVEKLSQELAKVSSVKIIADNLRGLAIDGIDPEDNPKPETQIREVNLSHYNTQDILNSKFF